MLWIQLAQNGNDMFRFVSPAYDTNLQSPDLATDHCTCLRSPALELSWDEACA